MSGGSREGLLVDSQRKIQVDFEMGRGGITEFDDGRVRGGGLMSRWRERRRRRGEEAFLCVVKTQERKSNKIYKN